MELVEIVGLVDASGAMSAGMDKDDWSIHINFCSWRSLGGSTQNGKLALIKSGARSELNRIGDLISPFDVIRARVVFKPAYDGNGIYAEMREFLGPERDAEFARQAKSLKKPIIVRDTIFGKLIYNRKLTLFSGEVPWCGKTSLLGFSKKVSISLQVESEADIDAVIEVAREVWKAREKWNREAPAFAVQELLALKNDSWLNEGEANVSPERFKKAMKLESISISKDGSFEFWYDDGELFWGHSITVYGTIADGLTRADIPG